MHAMQQILPLLTLLLLSLSHPAAASSHGAARAHRRHARRALPSGWQALGCMTDADARTLDADRFSSDSLTLESCIAGCSQRGYTYAGAEFYGVYPLRRMFE